MKKLLLMLSFIAGAQWAMAQDNAEKNLVKSFDTNGATSISFECKQKDIKNSLNNNIGTLRVELLVKANMPEQVLEQLVKAGRYTLEGKLNDNGEFVIYAPKIDQPVSVRGKDLVDEVTLIVQTPGIYHLVEGKKLEKNTEALAARSTDEAEMKKFKVINHNIETVVRFESTLTTSKAKGQNKAATPAAVLKFGDIIMNEQPIEIH